MGEVFLPAAVCFAFAALCFAEGFRVWRMAPWEYEAERRWLGSPSSVRPFRRRSALSTGAKG